MSRSGVKTALVLVLLSVVAGFVGKMLLFGGILGWSLPPFAAGLGLLLLSSLLLLGGVLYAAVSWLRAPSPEEVYGRKVYESSDSKAYCMGCGRVITKDGRFCRFCGREMRL